MAAAFITPFLTSMGVSAATAGTISTIASVGSMLFQGIGALQQSRAEEASAKYNARVAMENSQLSREQTAQQVEQQRREDRLRTGELVARSGGMTGSPLDVLADNIGQQELNILNIRHQGLLKERSYKGEAMLEAGKAKTARSTGKMGLASSLLTGATKLGGLLA